MISEQLKRGTIELVLLAMLQDGDKYGYQLVQELFAKSKGMYELQEGSMYPSLYRLQERGFISTYEKVVCTKRRRVYYHLTEEGKVYLEKIVAEFRKITAGIELIFEGGVENEE